MRVGQVGYNLKWQESKKRKKEIDLNTPSTSGKSKKSKLVDPELSLPEESDMDENVRKLLLLGPGSDKGGDASSESSEGEDDNDDTVNDMLLALSNEVDENEEKGPPVRENLAKCFNDIWCKPLSREKHSERLKRQKIPANLKLRVKKCNSEIWKNMISASVKTKDLKLQKIQTAITKTSAKSN